MEVIARIRQDFAYNVWANREILRALTSAPSVPPRAAEVMAHLVGAEWAWLRRLGQPSPDLPVWPAISLQECDGQLRALSATWKASVDGLTPVALERELSYTNFKGERWTNTVHDILAHVFTHACYHRGQIASFIGRAGHPVPYTDYIECVRRGHLAKGWPDVEGPQ